MKKLNLLTLLLIFILSCDNNKEPGSLEIEVSYFYNNYQGYKPDVGAKAFLFTNKEAKGICIDSMNWANATTGIPADNKGELMFDIAPAYKGEVGISGTVYITGIEAGDYLLILASEGRFTFSTKNIEIISGQDLKLVKNFGYYHEFDLGGESW